jgi:hypothetical protein
VPNPDIITRSQLNRLLGMPGAPIVPEGRSGEDFARDTRILPSAVRHGFRSVPLWAHAFALEARLATGRLLVRPDCGPRRDAPGQTLRVTRARPKIDRIACARLIRRFIDPAAVFFFVVPAEVAALAECFGATPFDSECVLWSHRGELCTFNVRIEELGVGMLLRGADTSRHDLAPQAAALPVASLGLLHAFYRCARDATAGIHHWPAPGSKA